MPICSCPNCQKVGRLLEYTSTLAYVYYYRCDSCGHVWTLDRNNPNAPPKPVTVPVQRRQEAMH